MPSANFSANVTKYNAGGSGDNIIDNGYIKTVEKVWIDSYTFAHTSTKTTLDIATLPDNAKLTSIDVFILTTTSQTNGTLSLGWSEDASYGVICSPITVTHNLTLSSIKLPGSGIIGSVAAVTDPVTFKNAGFQAVASGTKTTITLQFNNWTMTSGTVKTIVRYT